MPGGRRTDSMRNNGSGGGRGRKFLRVCSERAGASLGRMSLCWRAWCTSGPTRGPNSIRLCDAVPPDSTCSVSSLRRRAWARSSSSSVKVRALSSRRIRSPLALVHQAAHTARRSSRDTISLPRGAWIVHSPARRARYSSAWAASASGPSERHWISTGIASPSCASARAAATWNRTDEFWNRSAGGERPSRTHCHQLCTTLAL